MDIYFVNLLTNSKLEAAGIFSMKQIPVRPMCWPGDMKLYVWLRLIIVVEDVTILGNKDVKRIRCILVSQMRFKSYTWDNTALPPAAIWSLDWRCQLICSSCRFRAL